jgi:exosortase
MGALARIVVSLKIFPLPADQQLSIAMAGLVLWWMGAFLVSFGASNFYRTLFPLCFLFWLVPLPEILLNPIVRLLQQGSVESGRLLFAITEVPVAQYGTQLTIPGLVIEVARECSSIRSSLMLLVTTMVVAHVSLQSRWRKAVIIAAAVPLSVVKNGLRIFVLGILTTRVDQSYISGRLHHEGGIIYFAIALAVIILLIWVARRSETHSDTVSPEQELAQSASSAH